MNISLSIKTRIEKVLRENRLSVTDSRKMVLKLFMENDIALDHAAIEKGTGEKYDRVTIYRTLQSFLEKGIIHLIPTNDNTTLYALCKECDHGFHYDNHVHFICNECHNTQCLEDVLVPEVKLPDGFIPSATQMTVTGTCKKCMEKKSS